MIISPDPFYSTPPSYTILPVQAAKETLAVNFFGAQRLTEVLLPELHLDDEKKQSERCNETKWAPSCLGCFFGDEIRHLVIWCLLHTPFNKDP